MEQYRNTISFEKSLVMRQEDENDDDDDIDLFGSNDDEETAEKENFHEECLHQNVEKKFILMDVKPWDDEMDMMKLEESVHTIQMNSLMWKASKLILVGCRIKKLKIQSVVEEYVIGTDSLEEEISTFEDHLQRVDIVTFNNI
ncbi:elongation factor 1-delta-like [Hemiscyllium ocellatum]|uniref:elongation factor 1-delta-like n=1 Tax=Hemiscyllium ocellatum TaxID=170820 RepID=UPI002966AA20|nr:elongation factor 1-delta-like [Hemiscyllium ocellatum]